MNEISPPVIYYHSVAPALFENWSFNWLTLKLRFFEDQMAFLRGQGFRSVFLDEWLACRRNEKRADPKSVCLTFDDGLLDNWGFAFPVAKKYGMRFTLFVSPEFVDPRDLLRPTLEDVWQGRCKESELEQQGYVTWNELKMMQDSGVVDVQSHTMTHAKFISSPQIRTYYYGGPHGVYPILNAFPEIKPYYMVDPGFEERLPWGSPVFEDESAVIARKHFVNPDFIREVSEAAKSYAFSEEDQRRAFESRAGDIYRGYREADRLITGVESKEAYRERLAYEIKKSKSEIEHRLGKSVEFLCWPHGDNNLEAHAMAREAGYLATTSGKMHSESEKTDRIPRFGAGAFRNNVWLSRLKFYYKIASHLKRQPFYSISLANEIKNKLLKV